ncbi:response regulator transcription factor [Roseibium sp. M-1]
MEDISIGVLSRKSLVSVVDDDAAMRAALVDLLDSAGWDSIGYSSGEKFIESGATQTSDVIITDIQMQEINGLDLLDLLKERYCPRVPVIVITALTDEGLERQAIARGCYAFLRKPFSPEVLLGYVQDAIDLK